MLWLYLVDRIPGDFIISFMLFYNFHNFYSKCVTFIIKKKIEFFLEKNLHQNPQMTSLNPRGLLDSLLQELVSSKPNTILSPAMEGPHFICQMACPLEEYSQPG